MVRLAILNHETHQLFIEDVPQETIDYYGGEEEYIREMYTFEGEWSWDFIVDCVYYDTENEDGISVEFTDLV